MQLRGDTEGICVMVMPCVVHGGSPVCLEGLACILRLSPVMPHSVSPWRMMHSRCMTVGSCHVTSIGSVTGQGVQQCMMVALALCE